MRFDTNISPRSRLLSGAVVLVLAGLVGLVVSSGRSAVQTNSLHVQSIIGPASSEAGETIPVQILTAELTGSVELVAFSGFSTTTLHVEITNGVGTAELPQWMAETAGRLTLLASDQELHIDVLAGLPTRTAEVMVGPRTVVADATDETMSVVSPADEFGNAVGNDTPVRFNRTTAIGVVEAVETKTTNGIAYAQWSSGVVAGPTQIWAASVHFTSAPARIDEVAGLVVSIDLNLPTELPPGNGVAALALRTDRLEDRFGNILPDGVDGRFVIRSRSGSREVPAIVLDGHLIAHTTAPSSPEVWSVTAVVHGVVSDSETMQFSTAVTEVEGTVAPTSEGFVVKISAVIGPDGALLTDGTPIRIGDIFTSIQHGQVEAMLDEVETSDTGARVVKVDVLGTSFIISSEPTS